MQHKTEKAAILKTNHIFIYTFIASMYFKHNLKSLNFANFKYIHYYYYSYNYKQVLIIIPYIILSLL